ncbi:MULTISPECIES: type III-B CRISPR-associated protein Cas10/Cmr2 [Methylococcus]|uniref:Type III-B CRISPR-associated protein Cas10/Cmr2 n=1 Tax=Methylococcus capsulatus TaxID=414 RepID=A0ABZ2F3W2_METCP|nr:MULTISPECIES: type III-B CRISPR-associated protein Cas10/Cmr2 [Methylococcus]MDF9391732.1 type III-B CRISPR-associated protein Cas10/Cmr2 [Methylococcus capsulatus]
MENTNYTLWQTKLAARLHDPAEKALVLLRDPAGHENGTSRALTRLLGLSETGAETLDPDNADVLSTVIFKKGLPREIYRHVQRADWWAAAADRPQWPMQEITVTTQAGKRKTLKVADWAQVRWTNQPVLIHPLTGKQYALPGGLSETDFHDIKQRSFEHFSRLLVKLGAEEGETRDLRKTLLAYWRFGPDLSVNGADTEDFGKLGALWGLLPADTRIPDHSIWDHLDLTSAFAGAFAADPNGESALLALSIGPVQSFIATARTTSDLWAGSHLLARLSWEAMRPVCERLGPDAILFPRLRGIPQVDLWLRDQMELPGELFQNSDWTRGATDANPLFSAALPNRFVAVVPASQARAIADEVTQAVRGWLQRLGEDVVMRLLHEAGFDKEATHTPYEQMKEQLEGFPEVHWAAVPFSLIRPRNEARQTDLDVSALSSAMAPFFSPLPVGEGAGGRAGGEGQYGFLATPAWQVLQQEIDWGDGTTFFAPNPGVLYPAVYDLAERVMAAAKATRTFDQTSQTGWRCSLTGETEWLTTDRAQLAWPPGQRKDTLWTRVADEKPAWAKKGEHLGALPAIKRLWPTIFAEEVGKALNPKDDGTAKAIGRFVVSTHTMALAHQLDQWLEKGGHTAEGLASALKKYRSDTVALPRRLMRRHQDNPALADAKCIPGLLESARDDEDDDAYEKVKSLVRQTLALTPSPSPKGRGEKREEIRLETYYALLMMDGDRMGAILSGDDKTGTAISYRDSFHPQVRTGFDAHAARQDLIRKYGAQKRPISPNRHLAISGALNDFSQTVVRHVVEEEHLGRVIYVGGDDVLAMLPVADLLPTMQRLRYAYSGVDPEHEGGVWQGLTLQGGFAALRTGHGKKQRLQVMRMMGHNATASCGAVIAHHQAPLGAVLRELRAAEQRAKTQGGRDAFSVTVIKRSGGALYLTAKWGEPIKLLLDLRDFLAQDDVSRRAIFHTHAWLRDLPEPHGDGRMLADLLTYQLVRQAQGDAERKAKGLAERLTELALQQPGKRRAWLENFLSVAEFLARETRSQGEDA